MSISVGQQVAAILSTACVWLVCKAGYLYLLYMAV